MRDGSLLGLAVLAAAAFAVPPDRASADPPTAAVRILAPAAIRVGDRAAVVVEVTFSPASALPLLLTPTSEGTAIEVARGRLLRSDAEDPNAPTLRFRVPLVARAPGTAVLRVRVASFACGARCRPVEGEAELVLRVERRAE